MALLQKEMNKIKNILSSYKIIWQTVRQIPKGKVATYGEIAKLSGFSKQARLVGYALNKLPSDTKIPWYRVINSKGTISFPKRSKAYKIQKSLLESEGIEFNNEKIDFKRYSWIITLEKSYKKEE